MNSQKACVVFTTGMDAEAQSISQQLAGEGFDICTAKADQEVVQAAQTAGVIPEEIKSCIENAAICIFLIPEEGHEPLTAAAGHAGASGKRIVAVAENVESLPQIFDDIASSVIAIESPQLKDVIQGKRVWARADGATSLKRDINRVKCQ